MERLPRMARAVPAAASRAALAMLAAALASLAPHAARALPSLDPGKRIDQSYEIAGIANGPNGTVWAAMNIGGQGALFQGYDPHGNVVGGFSKQGIRVRSIAAWKDSAVVILTEPDGNCTATCSVVDFAGNQSLSFQIPNSGGFGCAYRVAVAPDSTLYVLSDICNVGAYDIHSGVRQNLFSAGSGSADGNFPMAFVVDRNGTLLVAVDELIDTGSDLEDVYRLRRVQPGGSGTETLLPAPCTSLGVDLSGLAYVGFSGPPTLNQDYLKVYDPSGSEKLSQVWHSPHSVNLVGIACDPECGVWIAADSAASFYVRRLVGDQDGDGLCDSWEDVGLEIGSNLANWKPTGCSVGHKDLYLEIDAMSGRAPDPQAIQDVADKLAEAPSADMNPPNATGGNGITLHWQIDETDLTIQKLCGPTFWAQFDAIKGPRFGTSSERSQGAGMLTAKDRVYRYALFGDELWHDCGNFNTSAVGRAKNVGCRDLVLGLGNSPYKDDGVFFPAGTRNQQASVLMHELGHAIGLQHGGHDNVNYKINYRSVMNYTWNFPTWFNEQYWVLGYSNRAFSTMVKSCLNEQTGNINGDPNHYALMPRQNPADGHRPIPETEPVDYDLDGSYSTCQPIPWLDREDPAPAGTYLSWEDWPYLQLSPAHNFTSGVDGVNEMLYSEVDHFVSSGPFCDCNHDNVADWRDIALGHSLDANADGIPDECQGPRVSVNRSLMRACPRGDEQHLEILASVASLCAYDTGSVRPPIFAVSHVAGGSDLHMWGQFGSGPDTLVSYVYNGDDVWLIGQSAFSGHGHVSFDLYAGPTYLGSTPSIEVRSLDLDPLCVGAVDPYDVAAVVAHYGPVGDPRYDLDDDGLVGPADSTLVADHVTDGMHRELLAPNDTLTVAEGDTLGLWWVPGQGDSALVTVLLERDETYGTYETILPNLPDNGHATWLVNVADAPRSDYRIRLVRHFGLRQEYVNDYDWDESSRPFTITSTTATPAPILPSVISFRPVGPNPVRTAARFAIGLPAPADVRLDVVDLGGRLIRRIAAHESAGRHDVVWDLSDDAGGRAHPGVYFVRFQAGAFTARGKVVVIR